MFSLNDVVFRKFYALFNDVSYGRFSHSDVWDFASHSDDSLGPPVSLNDGFDRLVLAVFKCLKMFRMLEIISALKPFVKLI